MSQMGEPIRYCVNILSERVSSWLLSVNTMNFTFNLRDFGPLLVQFLDKPDRLALRAACRDGRVAVDGAITAVTTENSARPDQFATFLNGMLSRGSRPTRLHVFESFFADARTRSNTT